jgi:hypothetical protein
LATRLGGREIPGRFSFWERVRVLAQGERLAAPATLAAAVLVTRLPFRTHYLLNWDAAQFALGMARFDVVHHQPHPPGYIGYVALGRLLQPLFGDANAALVALSIAGECTGVIAAFLFARSLFGPGAAWVTGLAMLASPLFWYYGEAANTYAIEPLTVIAIAWFAWRCWNREAGAAMPLGLAMAAAGALRPSTPVLMAPLVLLALWRLGSARSSLAAAATAVGGTLLWVVPLLVLAGGPLPYLQASLALGGDVTSSTAFWRAGLGGLLTTSGAVLRGAVWELGGFTVLALFGLLVAPRLVRKPDRLPAGWAPFAWAWALPGLMTFLFVHIGQVVYVQLFTPALFLSLGPAVFATARALGRPSLAKPITALGAAAGVVIFLLPAQWSLAGQLRQHDALVAEMAATVGSYDPDHTVLFADGYAIGSYRTAQVYLPDYHRVAIAGDRHGRVGEIFGDVYLPENFDAAGPLALPPGTDTVIFLDRSLVDAHVADPERLVSLRMSDGSRIYVWKGAAPRLWRNQLWLGAPYNERRGLES